MFHVPIILQYFVLQTAGVEHQTWVNTTSSSSTSWSLIKRKIVEPLYLQAWEYPHLSSSWSLFKRKRVEPLHPTMFPQQCASLSGACNRPRRILIHHPHDIYSRGRESIPVPYLVLGQAWANSTSSSSTSSCSSVRGTTVVLDSLEHKKRSCWTA